MKTKGAVGGGGGALFSEYFPLYLAVVAEI